MDFKNKMPEWKNEGNEPSETLKTNGFAGTDRLPATILNWFMALATGGISELQEAFNGLSAEDIKSGILPIEFGGTGASTATEATMKLLEKTRISSDNLVDADKLLDVGIYRCYFDSDTLATDNHFPSKYGTLFVTGSSSYKAQVHFDVLNNVCYFRTTSSGSSSSWRPWRRMLMATEAGAKGQVLGFTDTNKVAPMTITPASVGALANKADGYTGDMNSLTDGLWRIITSATNTPIASTAGVCLHKEWDSNFAIQLFFPSQNKMYHREKLNNKWTEWSLVYDNKTLPTPKDYMFQETFTDDNVKDLNSVLNTGVYQIYLTSVSQDDYNFPSKISKYGLLIVDRGSTYTQQTYYDVVGMNMYYRTAIHTGTEWGSWKKVVTEGEAAKITTGTYIGGGDGVTITTDFKPKLLVVGGYGQGGSGGTKSATFCVPYGQSSVYANLWDATTLFSISNIVWGENSVSWSGSGPTSANNAGSTYRYTVIG